MKLGSVSVGARKEDFLELVNSYRERHEKEADPQTLFTVASALLYDSLPSCERYLNRKLIFLQSWALAKDTLEGIVHELTSENPAIGRLLRAPVESLPAEIGTAVTSMLEQISSVLYNRLNVPLAQTEEFAQLKASAQDLYDKRKQELDVYSRLCEEVERLIASGKSDDAPESTEDKTISGYLKLLRRIRGGLPIQQDDQYVFASALQIVTEGAQLALDEAATNLTFSKRQTVPVNAMLYLLRLVKTQEERAELKGGLRQYEQSLAELVPVFTQSRLPLLRYLTRLNEVIAEATHPQTVLPADKPIETN